MNCFRFLISLDSKPAIFWGFLLSKMTAKPWSVCLEIKALSALRM